MTFLNNRFNLKLATRRLTIRSRLWQHPSRHKGPSLNKISSRMLAGYPASFRDSLDEVGRIESSVRLKQKSVGHAFNILHDPTLPRNRSTSRFHQDLPFSRPDYLRFLPTERSHLVQTKRKRRRRCAFPCSYLS